MAKVEFEGQCIAAYTGMIEVPDNLTNDADKMKAYISEHLDKVDYRSMEHKEDMPIKEDNVRCINEIYKTQEQNEVIVNLEALFLYLLAKNIEPKVTHGDGYTDYDIDLAEGNFISYRHSKDADGKETHDFVIVNHEKYQNDVVVCNNLGVCTTEIDFKNKCVMLEEQTISNLAPDLLYLKKHIPFPLSFEHYAVATYEGKCRDDRAEKGIRIYLNKDTKEKENDDYER